MNTPFFDHRYSRHGFSFFPFIFYCFATFHQGWVAMAIKQAIWLDFTFAVLFHMAPAQSKHGGCCTYTDVWFSISFLSVFGSESPENVKAALHKLALILLSNGHPHVSHLVCDLSFIKEDVILKRIIFHQKEKSCSISINLVVKSILSTFHLKVAAP